MKPQATGITWYKEENYERLLSLFEDREKLPRTYAEWLKGAERGLRDLQSRGGKVYKVEIDPDEFVVWCREHGKRLDSAGRIAFVNHKVHLLISSH